MEKKVTERFQSVSYENINLLEKNLSIPKEKVHQLRSNSEESAASPFKLAGSCTVLEGRAQQDAEMAQIHSCQDAPMKQPVLISPTSLLT